jgi:hypothetical protein
VRQCGYYGNWIPNYDKAAYHRSLLRLHPDKIRHADDPSQLADVGLLHDAFLTLSSATLRSAYDAQRILRRRTDPRSAIVSFDWFEVFRSDGFRRWTLGCRCGGLVANSRSLKINVACIWLSAEAARRIFGWGMMCSRRSTGVRSVRNKSLLSESTSTHWYVPKFDLSHVAIVHLFKSPQYCNYSLGSRRSTRATTVVKSDRIT